MVIVGRLRNGVSLAQARAEIGAITTQVAHETPEGTTPPGALVNAIRDDLMGIAGRCFCFNAPWASCSLIACANVANLLLARYSARGHEFSVRTAIGASRSQIVRQVLAENLLLSGMGAAGGILFAAWSLRPILALVPTAAGLPFADPGTRQSGSTWFRAWVESTLLPAVRPGACAPSPAPRCRAIFRGVRPLPQRQPIECSLAKLLNRWGNRIVAHIARHGRPAGTDISTSFEGVLGI